jgi:hypothetical protein
MVQVRVDWEAINAKKAKEREDEERMGSRRAK